MMDRDRPAGWSRQPRLLMATLLAHKPAREIWEMRGETKNYWHLEQALAISFGAGVKLPSRPPAAGTEPGLPSTKPVPYLAGNLSQDHQVGPKTAPEPDRPIRGRVSFALRESKYGSIVAGLQVVLNNKSSPNT